MAKFQGKRITVATLETTPGLVVFRQEPGKTKFKLSAVNSTGTEVALDAITTDELTLELGNYEPKITAGTVSQYWRGDKTWQTLDKAAVGLGNIDNTSDLNKPISTLTQTALNLKADDADVVKLAGVQVITGNKTFSGTIAVPTPTANPHATTKLYVDTADTALQTQINNILIQIDSGMKVPQPIDCSTNPPYPSGEPGDTWKVTVGGYIGGAPVAGDENKVGKNDMIICVATSAGGSHTAVGANYFITQANIDAATESVQGISRKATLVEAEGKSSDEGFMSPLKTVATISKTSVRYDVSQSLTTGEKTQARTNIDAASISDLSNYVAKWDTWGANGFDIGVARPSGMVTGGIYIQGQGGENTRISSFHTTSGRMSGFAWGAYQANGISHPADSGTFKQIGSASDANRRAGVFTYASNGGAFLFYNSELFSGTSGANSNLTMTEIVRINSTGIITAGDAWVQGNKKLATEEFVNNSNSWLTEAW